MQIKSSTLFRYAFVMAAGPAFLLNTGSARADFLVPSWRGDQDTTQQEWNTFTDPTGLNSPDVTDVNPSGSATLQDLSGGSFITSGGNIYSPSVPLEIEVVVPSFESGTGTTTVWLQLRSLGTEVDPASVTLTSSGGSPLAYDSSQELARTALGGFGGFQVDTLFIWEVAGNSSSYTLRFDALGSSMSLDRVSVETRFLAAVPEPASLAMTGLGVALIGVCRARRRSGRQPIETERSIG